MATLVVGWDSDIDEFGWGVGVAESDDWDVDIGGFLDGLSIGAGIGHNDEAGLLEGSGDVVGEVTGGEATSDGSGTSVSSELEDGSLTIGTSRDNTDVGWVVNCNDDAGSHDNLLPTQLLAMVLVPVFNSEHTKSWRC